MKKLLHTLFLFFFSVSAFSQQLFTCKVVDAVSGEPLAGVAIQELSVKKTIVTDRNGIAAISIYQKGKVQFSLAAVGFKPRIIELNFPLAASDSAYLITLDPEEKILDQVVVSSTRTDSRIENTPTRVEVLGTEEVEEESGIKPAHIVSLLGDVAGIQSQQTSAVTGNTDLRIQGLPGDYVQLLRDGMPLFGGYAGSFGVLQLPPLDLKQIEIIKGAASTLYGGGAIAGIINIIPKKPVFEKAERYLLLNQSTLHESNINVFLSDREKKRGYTFFAGGTYQKAIDVNKDGFSDLPLTETILLHPTFFIYPNERNSLSIGIRTSFEERKGGDMLALRNFRDNESRFFILNRSYRNTIDASWEKKLNRTDKFTVKGTGSWYYRNIITDSFGMKAKQISFFTEASYLVKRVKHDIVAGLNVNGEDFIKHLPDSTTLMNYRYLTIGLFAQHDWKLNKKFTIESGLRTDFHNKFGSFILPRISLLFKPGNTVVTRLGGGLGYKIPTVFSNEIDERDYRNLLFDPNNNIKAEKSAGVNWDVNYKKRFNEVTLAINQSFFYTRIDNPLVPFEKGGSVILETLDEPITTRGFETWAQVNYKGLDVYAGYTLIDARKHYDPLQPKLELSARDKLATVISYEFSPKLRAGIEAAYTGRQFLSNGSKSPAYLFTAAMIRYDIRHFSFVLNGENLLDYRQTRKETILLPPTDNPRFKQIWGPIEGRVINLSVRVKF